MNRDDILKKIEEKYEKLGVPVDSMLEGLLWSTPITYWDYIQTDALLGLQTPRTTQPDEMVFIMYHQVNELLFKMVLWEIDQVAKTIEVSVEKFSMHLNRISRYFDMLCNSFTVMADGMEREQYLKFRNTLTPASGFQSAQYRKIEFASTELINLIDVRYRDTINPVKALYYDLQEIMFLYDRKTRKDHHKFLIERFSDIEDFNNIISAVDKDIEDLYKCKEQLKAISTTSSVSNSSEYAVKVFDTHNQLIQWKKLFERFPDWVKENQDNKRTSLCETLKNFFTNE